ncbi:MAG: septal ring lytic transglycosylase RlpA family protein [Rhodospirillales bacterium]|nr:septal ring lytic transglycosylase RlpA family protein [Rhodospirillales bacterium]
MIALHYPRWCLTAACLLASMTAAHAKRPLHHASPRTVHTVAAQEPVPATAAARAEGQKVAAADQTGFLGESGTASYYGPQHQGRRTAAGTRFDQAQLTAAHPWLPFGTRVRVTMAATGRSVVVVITDRLYSSRRIVDLSLAAARQLGMIQQGIATVTLAPAA